jgi:hypothetical protein
MKTKPKRTRKGGSGVMKISKRIMANMLVSGFALSALSLFAFNSPSFAQAPASKPNILFIMGDDIGWMQPRIYHRGLMVGEPPTSTASGRKAPSS